MDEMDENIKYEATLQARGVCDLLALHCCISNKMKSHITTHSVHTQSILT